MYLKKFTYISILHVLQKSYFGMKAFLHKDINFYTLYTVCIYKSVSLSGLCPNVLWKQQKQSL